MTLHWESIASQKVSSKTTRIKTSPTHKFESGVEEAQKVSSKTTRIKTTPSEKQKKALSLLKR